MKKTILIIFAAFILALGLDAAVSSGRRGVPGIVNMITEIDFSFSSNSIANRTTSMHGLAQALDGNAAHVEFGNGVWGAINNGSISGFFTTLKGGTGVSVNNQWQAFNALARGDPAFDAAVDGDTLIFNGTLGRWEQVLKGDDGDVMTIVDGKVGWGGVPKIDVSTEGFGNVTSDPVGDTSAIIFRIPYYNGEKEGTKIAPSQAFVDDLGNMTVHDFQATGAVQINGSLTVQGHPLGGLYSGFYNPTLVPLVNCDLTGAARFNCLFSRVGDLVTVSGRVQVRAVAAGTIQFKIPLPVPCDLTAIDQVAGVGTATSPNNNPSIADETASIIAEVATDQALVTSSAPRLGLVDYTFTFSYLTQGL
jgi:hypothetical protein